MTLLYIVSNAMKKACQFSWHCISRFDQTWKILLSWLNSDTPLVHSRNCVLCSCSFLNPFFRNRNIVAAWDSKSLVVVSWFCLGDSRCCIVIAIDFCSCSFGCVQPRRSNILSSWLSIGFRASIYCCNFVFLFLVVLG